MKKGGKIGLALGGGAAHGMAHIGVLDVLEKTGIPIDMIAGTSAGALVGALHAQGKKTSEIKNLVNSMDWKKLVRLIDLSVPRSGFIGGKRIKRFLASIIGDPTFDELKKPFACVATDIETGEEVVLSQGSVLEAVRASISIPAVFTVVKLNDRYLVDGGLVNPVPVSVLKKMKADFIIAVNVMPDFKSPRKPDKGIVEPSLIGIIMQSIYISGYSLIKHNLEQADVVIEPQLNNIPIGDFRRMNECIIEGRKAARKSLAEIKRKLKGAKRGRKASNDHQER